VITNTEFRFAFDTLRRLDDGAVDAQFRKAIDDATCVEDFDWQQIEGWTNDISAILHAMRPVAKSKRANVALKLAEYAIERISVAIDEIDRYDFRIYKLLDRAQKIHLAAAKATRPDTFELAQSLSNLDCSAGYRFSGYSFRAYAEVLGASGLAEYRRLTEQAWAALPACTPSVSGGHVRGIYTHLSKVLDHFAESEGNVDVRIALRTKYLPETSEYVRLVDFCLQQGRADTALHHAEEGLSALAGKPHVALARLTAKLLVEHGRKAEAQLRLRNGFNTAEIQDRISAWYVRDLCVELRAFGRPARDWLISRLEARIEAADKTSRVYVADLLVDILLDEQLLEAAHSGARKFPCSLDMKERVAETIEQVFPAQTIELFEELVRLRLAKGSWPHFSRALGMLSYLKQVQSVDEHQAYVSRLKERFARRGRVMDFLDWALEKGMTSGHRDSQQT
jgi:hypothetical protein